MLYDRWGRACGDVGALIESHLARDDGDGIAIHLPSRAESAASAHGECVAAT